ncbi:sensor histidine kinase [Demequina sp.]|uniref:GAF domain-containing sensor histidine kinase n=1 Tax=Demequina sp. TaxID=2050685 RepID=UPI003D0BEC05
MVSEPLLDAIVSLNAQLDLPHVLDRFLGAATEHTGANYAAINIVDADGISVDFHYTGVPDGVWARIGRAPNHVATLARIPDDGVIVIDELTKHPSFAGFPPGHPPMGAFLGTALRVRGEVFGYLYLADKVGGFTADDQDAVLALAAAASVAIDNAQLYERAVRRERWLEASQGITTELLSNPGEEDALGLVVESAMNLADAAHAALVLSGVGDTWVMEFTAGPLASELLGLVLPEDGFAIGAIRTGEGAIAAAPPGGTILVPVRDLGPTLYAPLRTGDRSVGLLMLWRDKGQRPFNDEDLATAQRFANQAAVALTLSELAHVKNVTQLLEERDRLADDLHDFVSQELFATAMQIEAISADVSPEAAERLSRTLDHVKRAQHEVRGVMSTLAGHRSSEPFGERINRELIMAQDSLGYVPTLHADWVGVDDAVAGDVSLGDDVVAVLRELLSNVARHADASAVHIDLGAANGRFSIVVTDNGIGPAGARNRHSGTSNLAGRALRRNGTFTLDPVAPATDHPGTRAEWNVEINE